MMLTQMFQMYGWFTYIHEIGKYSLQGIDFFWSYSIRTLERGFKQKKLAWWTINLLVRLFLKTPVSGKRIAWEVMFRRYDSPDASKHGFKTMGMISGYIRGMIRGYDSWVWFGAWRRVWFEAMQQACGHRFPRHSWKLKNSLCCCYV